MGEKSTNSRARNGRAPSAWGSAKRMLQISAAETINDNALSTKTASRPSRAATRPPKVAPTIRFTDHVDEASVFARTTSSRSTMLGMMALRAGSKNAASKVSATSSGYTSHTISFERMNSMQRTINMRPISAAIITCLRRSRSFTTPDVGPIRVCGRTCSTSASATDPARPVS